MGVSLGKSVVLLLVLVLAASGAITFLPVSAESKIVVFPDEHWFTFSDAMRTASEGATIYLKKGTYEIQEDPWKIIKAVSIIGEDQEDTILVFPPDTRTGYASLYPKIGFRVLADNFMISNLTITNCDYGISATANGTQISHLTTSNVNVRGSNCKISGSKLTGALEVYGYFNEIARNYIEHIKCAGSFNSIIGNTGMQSEIEVIGYSNFVAENSVGTINLSHLSSTTIYKNSVSHILLENCYNNAVCGNIIKGPTNFYGLLMSSGSGNVFYGNNVTDYPIATLTSRLGNACGVGIGGYDLVAEENVFYHNNFVDNFKDVSAKWTVLGVGNYWDNGVEGNYWDAYSGVDNDGDGIGDTEYTIKKMYTNDPVETIFGIDHYPLMTPFNISTVTVSLPEWMSPPFLNVISPENATYPSTDVSLNFTVDKQTSWIAYSLDGQDNVTVTDNITLSGLPSGLHKITIYAEDLFGNNGASEPVCFTIAESVPEPEPFPTTLVVTASAALLVAIGVALLVYFKKRVRNAGVKPE